MRGRRHPLRRHRQRPSSVADVDDVQETKVSVGSARGSGSRELEHVSKRLASAIGANDKPVTRGFDRQR
jgi:hypothetical protein